MSDALDKAKTFPLFAAPSPADAANWYAEHLGFPKHKAFGDNYAIAVRGALEIHFWHCKDRHIAENTSAYFEMSDTAAQDGLYAEWLGASKKEGFAPGRLSEPPKTFDHGMREFYVWDTAGNLLRFGVDTNA